MAFTFRRAIRENVPLILGICGPTGSGKSLSALKIATGLSGGKPFCVIDTESGRALHYAPGNGSPGFLFDHYDMKPPFSPEAYGDAIAAADAAGYPVVVVDSASHEWVGEGGCIDLHDEIIEEIVEKKRAQAIEKGWQFDEYRVREASNLAAWVRPKSAHKRMVSRLLQLRAHVVLCMRAEDKIAITKDSAGKTEIGPMVTPTGFKGMVPLCEKRLPFELTLSLLVSNERPGVPIPIKINRDHVDFFDFNAPITEEVGKRLAEWASGGIDHEKAVREAASLEALKEVWSKVPKAKQKDLTEAKNLRKQELDQAAKAAETAAT